MKASFSLQTLSPSAIQSRSMRMQTGKSTTALSLMFSRVKTRSVLCIEFEPMLALRRAKPLRAVCLVLAWPRDVNDSVASVSVFSTCRVHGSPPRVLCFVLALARGLNAANPAWQGVASPAAPLCVSCDSAPLADCASSQLLSLSEHVGVPRNCIVLPCFALAMVRSVLNECIWRNIFHEMRGMSGVYVGMFCVWGVCRGCVGCMYGV